MFLISPTSWSALKMPDPADFARAFGLVNGSYLGDYKISDLHIEHKVLQTFRKYAFPIRFVLKPSETRPNAQGLGQILSRLAAEKHRVLSHYGNPYLCQLTDVGLSRPRDHDGNDLVVHMTGVATRIRSKTSSSPKNHHPRLPRTTKTRRAIPVLVPAESTASASSSSHGSKPSSSSKNRHPLSSPLHKTHRAIPIFLAPKATAASSSTSSSHGHANTTTAARSTQRHMK
jgi:hypothetical protein